MPEDNRRRIKKHILKDIEEYEGENFTEKLLQWKNSEDNMSEELANTIESLKEIGEKQGKTVEELKEKFEDQSNSGDQLTKSDVRQAVEEALPAGMYQ